MAGPMLHTTRQAVVEPTRTLPSILASNDKRKCASGRHLPFPNVQIVRPYRSKANAKTGWPRFPLETMLRIL